MLKKYKWSVLLTSLITICPILIGLCLWNRLPDTIATHFGSNHTANGWSSKPFAVFGIPLIMLGIHLLCLWATVNDPKRKNIHDKIFKLILWIIPVMSLVVCNACYVIALGYSVDIGMIVQLMIGVLFIIIGNYMHKVKQNYTVGIKIPWTLYSEENWNRTHRLGAWLWILCGIVFVINSVLQRDTVVLAAILALLLVPMLYSFILYKKGI